MSDALAGLTPRTLWGHFSHIARIPRPSKREQEIAGWVRSVAQTHGFDVRSDAEWEGKNDRGNKRAGHMPGAVHIEWLNNLTSDQVQRLKPATELRAMFEKAGVTPDKEIVTVCQAGVRASHTATTLNLLGYKNVRVYDGSFGEWANREDTPIV